MPLQEIDFFIVFKCYIISIKDNTDIIWNELFQTVTGICLICVHTIYICNDKMVIQIS